MNKPRKLIKFEYILGILSDLSAWEQQFVSSIDNQLNRYGKSIDELSEKQLAVIDRIYDKHCKEEMPPYTELPEAFIPNNHNTFLP